MDILIRDISKEDAHALDIKAQAAGEADRMTWLRKQVHNMAGVPECYAFRVYGASGGTGTICRYSDHPNGTSPTFSNFDQQEADAMERASNFIRRNQPGDREKAIALLQEAFGDVFEIPV